MQTFDCVSVLFVQIKELCYWGIFRRRTSKCVWLCLNKGCELFTWYCDFVVWPLLHNWDCVWKQAVVCSFAADVLKHKARACSNKSDQRYTRFLASFSAHCFFLSFFCIKHLCASSNNKETTPPKKHLLNNLVKHLAALFGGQTNTHIQMNAVVVWCSLDVKIGNCLQKHSLYQLYEVIICQGYTHLSLCWQTNAASGWKWRIISVYVQVREL